MNSLIVIQKVFVFVDKETDKSDPKNFAKSNRHSTLTVNDRADGMLSAFSYSMVQALSEEKTTSTYQGEFPRTVVPNCHILQRF